MLFEDQDDIDRGDLKIVFDGKLVRETTLSEIRGKIENYLKETA